MVYLEWCGSIPGVGAWCQGRGKWGAAYPPNLEVVGVPPSQLTDNVVHFYFFSLELG